MTEFATLRSGGAAAFRHEAFLGGAVERLAFLAHRLAFAGIAFALFHEAGLGRAVQGLAVAAHRAAFA